MQSREEGSFGGVTFGGASLVCGELWMACSITQQDPEEGSATKVSMKMFVQ